MKKLVFLAILLIAIGYYVHMQIGNSSQEKREITAEIELINTCAVPANAFAIKKLDNGRTYSLAKGRVSIKTFEGEKLQLVLSPRYADVEYDGMIFKAKPAQRVTADCSFGEKQKSVTQGLNSTFSGGD